jgi:hypothetical protein
MGAVSHFVAIRVGRGPIKKERIIFIIPKRLDGDLNFWGVTAAINFSNDLRPIENDDPGCARLKWNPKSKYSQFSRPAVLAREQSPI